MTRKAKLLLSLALVASVMTLVTCKPIDYYLQRVYKAYGKVTDANTGEPLESVEVFLKGYQYSELTNALGDYEIELAEGTWTLEFVKDGYNTADSDPPVQVGPTNPRALVDAKLTPKQASLSIFDTWSIASLPVDGHTTTNVTITLNSNGTLSETFNEVNSLSGTFSPETLPLQTVITFTMSAGSGPDIPPLPLTVLAKFDNLTSTTVDIYADNMGDGFEGPFQFTRM